MSDFRCISCSAPAVAIRERRSVEYGKRTVEVDNEFLRCTSCAEEFYLPGQMEATDRRAAERVRDAGEPPLPFEIRRLRNSLGYSQAEFEKLIGAGPKTVVRWENGTVTPNETAGSLLRLLEAQELAVTWLAEYRRMAGPVRAHGGWSPANTIRVSVEQSPPDARTNVVDIAWYRRRPLQRRRVQARTRAPVADQAIG